MRIVTPAYKSEYPALVDRTGREVRLDKPGAVPKHLAPALACLEINQTRWVGTVNNYGRLFPRVAGAPPRNPLAIANLS